MSVPRYLRLATAGAAFAAGVYAASMATAYFWGVAPKHRVETAWLTFGGLFLLAAAAQWRTRPDTAGQPPALGVPTLSLLAVGLAVLTFALYRPVLSIGLLSDDFILVNWAVEGDYFGSWQFLRPLPLWIWSFVVQSLGAGGLALHALNIGLHGLNAALVVAVARRLGLASATACAAGLLFVCFPAAVEPVAWASGVQDLLMTTFCLIFILACAADRRGLGLVVGTMALVFALASKETAVVAPALAFAAWFRPTKDWNWRPIAVGAIVVAVYVPLRLHVIPVDQTFATWPSRYFVKELFSRLFSTLAVPFTRQMLVGFPVLGIAAAWLSTGVLLTALQSRGDRGAAVLEVVVRCGVWSVLSVMPVWSLFFVSEDLQGARYLYLAACGWSIGLAALFMEGLRQWLGILLTVVVAAVGIAGVHWHLQDWRHAARLRDRVLVSALSHLRETQCATIGFISAPDSVGGAYVFRNGFEEALARGGQAYPAKPVVGEAKEANCTLKWDGESFRPVGR